MGAVEIIQHKNERLCNLMHIVQQMARQNRDGRQLARLEQSLCTQLRLGEQRSDGSQDIAQKRAQVTFALLQCDPGAWGIACGYPAAGQRALAVTGRCRDQRQRSLTPFMESIQQTCPWQNVRRHGRPLQLGAQNVLLHVDQGG